MHVCEEVEKFMLIYLKNEEKFEEGNILVMVVQPYKLQCSYF